MTSRLASKEKEDYNRKMAIYRNANREKINHIQRFAHIKRKYGISEKDYTQMVASQSNKCALCGRPPRKNRLSIDHDHKTGKIRGLLCAPCNRALGVLGDSVDGLGKAVDYLQASLGGR